MLQTSIRILRYLSKNLGAENLDVVSGFCWVTRGWIIFSDWLMIRSSDRVVLNDEFC